MSRDLRKAFPSATPAAIALLLCCLSQSCSRSSLMQVQPPPGSAVPTAPVVEADDEPPERDRDIEAIVRVRRMQRSALAEGARWSLYLVWTPIIVGALVFILLYFTPSHLPSVRPFDKTRDRKKQSGNPQGSERHEEDGLWM